MGGEDGPSNRDFFAVLVVCLILGGALTPLLMRTMRRRRTQRQQVTTSVTAISVSTTGSTSLSGGVTTTGTVSLAAEATTPNQSFHIVCKPQPYKAPLIERPPGDDPYASEALVTVLEDIYSKKTPEEIVPRILKDIVGRAPVKSDSRFKLSAFRSEGPVSPEGTCIAGWTFFFVREDERLGCIAIVTGRELSLQFGSTTDVEIPYVAVDVEATADLSKDEIPDIAAAMAAVHAGVPASSQLPLYVRASLPDAMYVYTRDPLAIADVGIVGNKYVLRNTEGFQQVLAAYEEQRRAPESWTVDDLLGWERTGETTQPLLSMVMNRDGAELALRSGDKVLYRRIARGLHMAHGAMTVRILEDAIQNSLREDQVDEAKLLIRCLGFVPNATAIARLHTLSNTLDERVRSVATRMVVARRERSLGVRFDPLDELNFKELREAMGRPQVLTIALVSKSYDIRDSLLKTLADLRLQTKRIRVITSRRTPKKQDVGQFNIVLRKGLITAAYLRAAEGGDCEALLCVVPTPVPAYILHLAGSAAEVFGQRIRRQDLEYTRDMLMEDLNQRERQQLPALHRAVTYLKMWDPSHAPPEIAALLIDAYRSYPRAWQLRQSIIEALEHVPNAELAEDDVDGALRAEQISEEVDNFLTEELDLLRHPVTANEHRMKELLEDTLARRRGEGFASAQSVISMTGTHEVLPDPDEDDAPTDEAPAAPEIDASLEATTDEGHAPSDR